MKRPWSLARSSNTKARRAAIYQTIQAFPEQFLQSWRLVAEHPDLAPRSASLSSRVFYAAMGGSSLPADLINEGFEQGPHLEILRDYRLPAQAQAGDFVFAASFSGNTEETLSAFEDALARGCQVIALSHGGKLETFARRAGVPWIPIPACIQPRCATGYFFASILGIFFRLGWIASPEALLRELSDFLKSRQSSAKAGGKALAEALRDRVPIVYGPSEFAGTARIWKIKFNENAKVQSFSNVFPELNHNEMVGFTRLLMKPALIFLESKFMHPAIRRRMDVMEEILRDQMPIHRLAFEGKSPLFEMFESLSVADYASYYLAQAYGIDPAPVEMVETFKKKL